MRQDSFSKVLPEIIDYNKHVSSSNENSEYDYRPYKFGMSFLDRFSQFFSDQSFLS